MQQPNDGAAGLMRIGPAASSADVRRRRSSRRRSTAPASGELRVDLCVIGAGSGGLSVAAAAAQLGVSVVLIEKHKMGGDCLNYGCVPSKALIAAARRAHLMRTCGAVRHRADQPDDRATRACTTTSTASSPPSPPTTSAERFAGLGVKVIRAAAHFITRDTVRRRRHSASRRAAS